MNLKLWDIHSGLQMILVHSHIPKSKFYKTYVAVREITYKHPVVGSAIESVRHIQLYFFSYIFHVIAIITIFSVTPIKTFIDSTIRERKPCWCKYKLSLMV